MNSEKQEKSEMAQREEKILEFWKENNIFQKSLEKEAPNGEFVFYDGPATANGKPGIHHMEPQSFKDVIPRYKTMRGYHVPRKIGWDTHGLPVELQVEKALGLKSKKEIEKYGVEAFNKKCKESVWEYIDVWKKFTDRNGYWIDHENPYITYENSYIESVWNILKTVNDKKLLYKDYKVVPWCPRCGTALSSHELAQGYQDVKDLSVTVKFKVKNPEKIGLKGDVFLLAWTTTPWTLPGNVALAVGKNILYISVQLVGEKGTFIIAKDRAGEVLVGGRTDFSDWKGEDLTELEYEPLFPYLKDNLPESENEKLKNAFKVYPADFVNTEDGTGIVHTAVMYGQDDFELGAKVGLPKFHLVDESGYFIKGTGELEGLPVKDREDNGLKTSLVILKYLQDNNLYFNKESYTHSYPHCWRCKTPLIYYARDSWYIRMSELRDKLVKENEGIGWEPEHIKEGRFGEWLREVKDWAISRERYWGTPLPIWVNKDNETRVIGSIDDLKKYSKKSGNKYFVMRHGEAKSNASNILDLTGDPENHLTQKGEDEARRAASNLKQAGIDFIITSPFLRTRETAAIIQKELGLLDNSVIIEERIHEISPEEDGIKVRQRIGEFIFGIEQRYVNKNLLIISHGFPIWTLSKIATTQPINMTEKVHTLKTGELQELPFVMFPHNENYELDLHRPFIDSVELVENDEPLTRVKEVLDVWFDSGSMPFAQNHYPFETKDLAYPADYISEAIDQTRGWFYTLHAIGTLTGKGKAFKNVICLGHILDAQGKKMSKSLGNIVDPVVMIDKYGADALRFWMYSVNQPGDSKNFDEKTVDEIVKKVFNPALNILSFYDLYKDDSFKANDTSKNVLDRWIISRLNELVSLGTKSLDNYKIFEATRAIRDFVNDFSTWYVRRSRERFKSEDNEEKKEALETTKHVFIELLKYMAPFTPFFAESSYLRLRNESDPESVHLANWPQDGKIDQSLLDDMEKVREVVTKALELRQKAGHKVRQPLASLAIPEEFSQEFLDIISDEVNVKEIKVAEREIKLDIILTDELRDEGIARDIIRGIQDARKTENLKPNDPIKLIICADEKVMEIIKKYSKMIQSPTLVSEILYNTESQKYKILLEEKDVSISILR